MMIKLDPDRPLDQERLLAVMGCDADAIIIGGTQGITGQKINDLWEEIKPFPGRKIIEITGAECLVEDADEYWVPIVLNSTDPKWILGAHAKAIQQVNRWNGLSLPGNVFPVGYIVLNPESAVAVCTEANTQIDDDHMTGLAQVGHLLFRVPWIYIEYSGSFGSMDRLARLSGKIPAIPLIYGGGIKRGWQAKQAAQFARVVVVGNLVYESENLEADLREIRHAVRRD
ncbi:heptaprenylglyceryl phosphate synthase [Heliobacterium chlorum]|uniref:Heptaprenylglyceryl phosphate synthase n=1 Tax=Heliobacterium chlorum TaxID=2698 RepID=A0ABR7T4N8_HELCL|nr:heptaprenylglyceryl phosphate synthase [Heliobacterium chlorum]